MPDAAWKKYTNFALKNLPSSVLFRSFLFPGVPVISLIPILAVRQSAFGACRLLRHGLLELRVIQVRIKALLLEQFFVSALLYDVAVLHDKDHIRIAYGRQAVCDDKAGTSLHQMIHRFLDRHLCARINRRRRLVKN